MAKIGAQLQETRLKKGLTLDHVADDTNISVRFLSKIEADDFTGFPGEPYIVGFIKIYADYLGLDPDVVVATYRQKESAVPSQTGSPDMTGTSPPTAKQDRKKAISKSKNGPAAESEGAPEQEPTPSKPAGHSRKILGIVLLLIVAALLVFAAIRLKPRETAAVPDSQVAKPVEYRVEGTPFEKRLFPGDSLIIPLGDDVFKLTLDSIDETVNLTTPWGPFKLSIGQQAPIDMNKDAKPDATMTIVDYEKNKPASGALLHLEIADNQSAQPAQAEVTVPDSVQNATQQNATQGKAGAPTVLFKSPKGPYPFVVQVSFRGNCMFRYEADRKEWVEKYYLKGENLTFNVNSSLTAWASNAQAAKLVFQASGGKTAEMEMGGPGQIAVKKVSWSQTDGGWALVATDLD